MPIGHMKDDSEVRGISSSTLCMDRVGVCGVGKGGGMWRRARLGGAGIRWAVMTEGDWWGSHAFSACAVVLRVGSVEARH